MKEIWKPIKGFEGYEVSNAGRVRRITYKILKPFKSSGCLNVCLFNGEKGINKKVHRLVAEAFLEKPEGEDEVRHRNSNKKQNNVENLEWCSTDERIQLNGGSNSQKRVRCINDGKIFASQSEAARYYGISQQTVSALCRGARKAVGVPDFEYYYEEENQ